MIEGNSANDIYIVVDVIRATTSMAVMFDQGAARVLAAGTIEQAWEAAQKIVKLMGKAAIAPPAKAGTHGGPGVPGGPPGGAR